MGYTKVETSLDNCLQKGSVATGGDTGTFAYKSSKAVLNMTNSYYKTACGEAQ